MRSLRSLLVTGMLVFGVPAASLFVIDRLFANLPPAQAADESCVFDEMVVEDPYCGTYTVTDLGPVPGLPSPNGGLTFKAGDPDTLLIGGAANFSDGQLYAVRVLRDSSKHIIGFSGPITIVANAAYNDGGIVYGPNNTLFIAQWPVNTVFQTRLGVTQTRTINLSQISGGLNTSPGGLGFVPSGYPGAGKIKIAGYIGGDWWSGSVSLEPSGFYTITGLTKRTTVDVGPEGFIYVAPGSPKFTDYKTMLLAEYDLGNVAAYDIDSNGDPITSTRRPFISGLFGAQGATIDPVTGDFLFSTFGGGDRVVVVKGFATPPAKVTSEVQPATGGTISVASESAGTLNIPPGGVSSSTIITVEIVKSPNSAQSQAITDPTRRVAAITEVGAELSISGTRTSDGAAVTDFAKPVTITIALADSSQTGLNVTSATIKRYDPAQGQFVNTNQPTTFSSADGSFTTTDTKLSRYAVFGEITRRIYVAASFLGFKLP